jgi:hypothetical protein
VLKLFGTFQASEVLQVPGKVARESTERGIVLE